MIRDIGIFKSTFDTQKYIAMLKSTFPPPVLKPNALPLGQLDLSCFDVFVREWFESVKSIHWIFLVYLRWDVSLNIIIFKNVIH